MRRRCLRWPPCRSCPPCGSLCSYWSWATSGRLAQRLERAAPGGRRALPGRFDGYAARPRAQALGAAPGGQLDAGHRRPADRPRRDLDGNGRAAPGGPPQPDPGHRSRPVRHVLPAGQHRGPYPRPAVGPDSLPGGDHRGPVRRGAGGRSDRREGRGPDRLLHHGRGRRPHRDRDVPGPRRRPGGRDGRGGARQRGRHRRRLPPSLTGTAMRESSRGIHSVTLLPGDGIGPEITEATLLVLEATGAEFARDRQIAGAVGVEGRGDPLPDPALESIRMPKCALKGPLETPVGGGYRSVNVALRREFQLYANLRPVRTIVPFRSYDNIDIVLLRENTQGLYAGVEHFVQIGDDPKAVAESVAIVTREGCERICRFAFEYALHQGRRKVTLVHKANILKMVSGLFLEEGRRIAKEYDGRIECDEKIIDNAAMQLVMKPESFDVIVTTNMFGDILSDQMAGLVGGLGLAPSANIGMKASIFEAVHGTAPDLVGQGKANPTALMLSAAMMLEHLGEMDAGRRLREAVVKTIRDDGIRTGDLGGKASTMDFAKAVAKRVA